MKKYIIYDEDNDNQIMQTVQCPENEIAMYGFKNIECPDGFEFDTSKIQRVINGEVVGEYIQDETTTLNIINNTYNEAISSLVSDVPDKEVATFPTQEREARAWIKDNSEYTPLIDGILIGRTDVTKAELVDKIILKANALALSVGKLTGERQMIEKEVYGN